MNYTQVLQDKFKDLEINLVKHDTSPTGMPCYIEAKLDKMPKDKGTLALDLGNYIYRVLGLRYQMTPEYRGKGKKTTIRWFMSWNDIMPIRENIYKAMGERCTFDIKALPFNFRSLIIQNSARGVRCPSISERCGARI